MLDNKHRQKRRPTTRNAAAKTLTNQVPHPGKQPGDEHPPECGDPSHLLASPVGGQDLEVGAQQSQGHQSRGPQQPNQGTSLGGTTTWFDDGFPSLLQAVS